MADLNGTTEKLAEITQILAKIEKDTRQNGVDIKNIGFKSFFDALRECATPANLDQIAQIFGTGCDLLIEKLKRIQSFIQMLEDPNEILTFFSEQFDFESSEQFLSPHAIVSPDFPGISIKDLLNSLERLNNAQYHSITIFPAESTPPPPNFNIFLPEKLFETRKEDVFGEIYKAGNVEIAALLRPHKDPEAYYETFMAVLHLIQDGKINYSSSNQKLEVRDCE